MRTSSLLPRKMAAHWSQWAPSPRRGGAGFEEATVASSVASERHCSTAEPKSEPQRGEDEAEDENDDADDAGRDHGDEDDQQPHVRAREKEHTAHE